MTLTAASFGLMDLAAHNVMLRLFFFFATFGDTLSQCAQTFLPGIIYRKEARKGDNLILARDLTKKLMTISFVLSIVNSMFGKYLLSNKGALFTQEIAITSIMKRVSVWMGLSLVLHPFIMLYEGAIIAKRDLKYLVVNYGITLGLMSSLLKGCARFEQVWISLFIFQIIRLAQFGPRVWKTILQKKNERKIGKAIIVGE